MALILFGLLNEVQAQNVGINATGAAPDASALLDLSATNKGFLITRVDTGSITAPAFGLMTLAPSDTCLYLYNGAQWMGLGGGGTSCTCNFSTPSTPPTPTFPCGGTVIPIVDVTSTTGQIWMDRNLGASQVATSSNDAAAYGDLYQWGRCSDGHEKRTASSTTTLSATDTPGNSSFIIGTSSIYDWRSPQNDNLWQGVSGINNPCPAGYRLPTDPELRLEKDNDFTGSNAAGAFGGALKLTAGGLRDDSDGLFKSVGSYGYYWTSTTNGNNSHNLQFYSTGAGVYLNTARAHAFSVRCIKD